MSVKVNCQNAAARFHYYVLLYPQGQDMEFSPWNIKIYDCVWMEK